MLVTAAGINDQKEADVRYPTGLKLKHTQNIQRTRHTQHARQRSSSLGTTFYSSTILPQNFAPLENEALSSLINSLTLISDTQKAGSTGDEVKSTEEKEQDDFIHPLAISPESQPAFNQNQRADTNDEEQDYCPPPVAGYNTINAVNLLARPKTTGNDRAPRRPKKKSHLYLKTAKSQGNLKATELYSPDSVPVIPLPRSSCNESVASLPLSTNSKLSSKNPFKMFFATRASIEQNRIDMLSECHPPSEKERDPHRFSAFVRVDRIKTDLESSPSESKTLASISPSPKTEINENLIPSRRSSLRNGPRQSSRGSRDLRSLNIDQDLIEENHETVQRIRELQEAREKRLKEWRKEARRSEKAAKRLSMPTPSPSPIKQPASVRSSWHSKAADVPGTDEPLNLSARVSASDLAMIPVPLEAAENEPLTPIDREEATGGEVKRQVSLTASTTQSLPSVRRHRQRLSDSLKRASSIRQPISDDAKGVCDEVDAYLGSPRFSQRILHPRTGRTITFSEVGDPDGYVVLCCVGMGLTRYVTSFYDEIAKAQKLRIITPDRPGVGETEPMPAERSTPLAWVDDVAVICSRLGIEKFSLLAHSAGAIYALATALKMPQYVRGRIHLLGPWIPPSQLAVSGQNGDAKAANLPTSHKLLSFLPASFMKAANSRFLSATSASIEPRTRKGRQKDKALTADLMLDANHFSQEASLSRADITQHNTSMLPTSGTTPSNAHSPNQPLSCYQADRQRRSPSLSPTPGSGPNAPRPSNLSSTPSATGARTPNSQHQDLSLQARANLYNTTLTHRTWSLATLNANPAVDLIICLERRRPIGFRYTDITRTVVIHHGANDTRVPLENVRWLSTAMKKCDLRVLENEGHGLMASASVMSEVLGEVGREWEEWAIANKERQRIAEEERRRSEETSKGSRRGYPRW